MWRARGRRRRGDDWAFPLSPVAMWDSAVRKELHRAAAAEGCDFPGFGSHSFRRTNITWRQEVGGSSIEASKIAGHATVRMTEEYTVVQLKRQDELTRHMQDKLANAKKRAPCKNVVDINKGTAA
jgi:integrase